MDQRLDIITSVLPPRSEFLPQAAQSIKKILDCPPRGWKIRWFLGIDGPEALPRLEVDPIPLRFTTHMGPSRIRNALIAQSEGGWIMNLDADDAVDPTAFRTLLEGEQIGNWQWVSGNLLMMNGAETSHWLGRDREWKAGELAENWTSPFPFHPGVIIARRELIQQVGGWPEVETNEDLGLTLLMSELSDGLSSTQPLIRYRIWEEQTTSQPQYRRQKIASFRKLELLVNKQRTALGRPEIIAPFPQPPESR